MRIFILKLYKYIETKKGVEQNAETTKNKE